MTTEMEPGAIWYLGNDPVRILEVLHGGCCADIEILCCNVVIKVETNELTIFQSAVYDLISAAGAVQNDLETQLEECRGGLE